MTSRIAGGMGAKHKPVSRQGQFQIVKRIYTGAPYEEALHEYLAFDGDRLVGRVSSFEVPIGSKECWINDLWIEQQHRSKGLGKKLLRVTVDNARAHGYQRLLGELTPYDGVTQEYVEAFYRNLGFEVVPNWEGTRRTVVVLFV